ncbi:hypothetical protein GQ55_9G203600 [Panicum hallii var. hallii]|uniref:DUF834 domain-containing protein n=1 Tax=Panicum hallii var. hallii TaxID=1504633 RepID=A0A2T7C5A0_9POAL|nr:hypothetical protein GQ55_9G203600 [Panicum hallii var. hallii]
MCAAAVDVLGLGFVVRGSPVAAGREEGPGWLVGLAVVVGETAAGSAEDNRMGGVGGGGDAGGNQSAPTAGTGRAAAAAGTGRAEGGRSRRSRVEEGKGGCGRADAAPGSASCCDRSGTTGRGRERREWSPAGRCRRRRRR